MNAKLLNSFLIILIIILLLSVYWFVPLDTTEFNLSSDTNTNFSLNSYENSSIQFYPNMRFPDTKISYRIESCSLQRKNDMEWAFDIIEEKTVLEFHSVEDNEQIIITCDEADKSQGKYFIAGEGGPTNITVSGELNVIEAGKILLLKDSDCERPNIAIHELLHVLGFDHSENQKNIMYEISRCDQVISEDIINFINNIYSTPTNSDLLFENAYASMHGKYLDINFSIRNNGLDKSGDSVVKVIVDGKEVEDIDIPSIGIGEGRRVSIVNIWVKQIDVENIEFFIENDFEELNKINNKVSFKIKK